MSTLTSQKKRYENVQKGRSSYLKQQGHHYLYPIHFALSVRFGKTVMIGTKCDKF